MKRLFFAIFLFSLVVLSLSGCGCSKDPVELVPGDYLYDMEHVFAHGYDGDELVELHLYDELTYYHLGGGPDALTVLRGNKSENYTLKLEFNGVKDDLAVYEYALLDEKKNKVGTLVFRGDYYDYMFGVFELKTKRKEVKCHYPLFINSYEKLIPQGNETAALQLISALNCVDRVSEDWPVAAKNLDLFLHRDLKPETDLTSLDRSLDIAHSPDGRLTSFFIRYYAGGNGPGSIEQREILQYWSEGNNHVIEDFDRWAEWENGSEYNSPYLSNHRMLSWGEGDDTLYFIEYSYQDQIPMVFDDGEHAKKWITVLGAFRIVDGSIVPVEAIKTRNSSMSKVIVESENETGFKLDAAQGVLGVPLIEKDDYHHHGKYLLYEWNPKSKMFEYNGRTERL